MKTIPMRFEYDYPNLEKISIDNEMAPLSIANSDDGKIIIEAEIALPDRYSDLNLESYFRVTLEELKLKVDFDCLAEVTDGSLHLNQSQIHMRVPKGVELKVEAENLPLQLSGLENKISADNENAAIFVHACEGKLNLENENGPIRISQCAGNISIKQENGPIMAEEISGHFLKVSSENGAVKIRLAQFNDLSIENENGMIYYESLPIEQGGFDLSNENGKIVLVLPEEMEYAIEAKSELGRVRSSLKAEQQRIDGKYLFTNGEPKVKINVKTENGSIRLSSDPSINLGAFKSKLDDLRETIKEATSLEDNEKVQQILQKTVESLNAIKDKVTEAKINEAIQKNIASLRETLAEVNWIETKDKVLSTIEKINTDINNNLRKFFEKVRQTDPDKESGFNFGRRFDDFGDTLQNIWSKRPSWGRSGRDMDDELPRDVSEQSRRKILQMLENGKITADEAERLLRAIGKE
jgi:DUF4097 and DUF4098 domain-containing protein YvlB